VRNAALALGSDEVAIVMNGDILFWPDLEGALSLHHSLGAIATVVLREDPRARELGALGLDASGRVRTLLGKPEHAGAKEHMFTGVHVLSARALAELPSQGCIIRTAFRRWIDEGEVVGGFVDASPWRDLGTPREYLRANLDLVSGRLRWPGVEASGVLVGEGALVDGVLEEAVVGERASVRAKVVRSVVWAGARVETDAIDCVVAGDVRVSP
jgi:NDP-sugar pyrophosphorylase family protein